MKPVYLDAERVSFMLIYRRRRPEWRLVCAMFDFLGGELLDRASRSRERVFDGARLFHLKGTHGLPLDFALDRIVGAGFAVEWTGFIEAARENGWWDYQTYETICYAMNDAMLTHKMQREIGVRVRRYMMEHQNPRNA